MNGPWTWFATFTFRIDLPEHEAYRRFRRWVAQLRQAAGGREARLKFIVVCEYTYLGRVHLHALLAGRCLEDISRMRWMSRWERLEDGQGMARIYPAVARAAPYLAKYLSKSGLCAPTIEVGGRLTRG